MPVVNASHPQAQLDPRGLTRQVRQQRVPLEHRVLRRTVDADLEEMIHGRDRREAGLLGKAGDLTEVAPDRGQTARPGEVGKSQADLHAPSTGEENTSEVLLYGWRRRQLLIRGKLSS